VVSVVEFFWFVKAVSPDGEAIVTGAGDETLRFWNVFSKVRSQKVSAVISCGSFLSQNSLYNEMPFGVFILIPLILFVFTGMQVRIELVYEDQMIVCKYNSKHIYPRIC
jgi:hypothetical protein